MQRIAFQLRIRPGCESDYDEAHRHVWPELLRELVTAGVQEYSIFRRDQELFLYMVVLDFGRFLECMDQSQVDRRWQEKMSAFFDQVPSLRSGERLAMMEEVFHLSARTGVDHELEDGRKGC